MQSLYSIVKSLQTTSGTNAKLQILQDNVNNHLLKEFLRVTLDPRINFYISEKTFPEIPCSSDDEGKWEFNEEFISDCVSTFFGRKVTGDAAKVEIRHWGCQLDLEEQELFKMLLCKDIKAGIGATLINRVWKNLIFEQPYMRCSLPKDAKFNNWPWERGVFSQIKADGMYAAVSTNQIITRAGNVFPRGSFPVLEKEIESLVPNGFEWNGELIVFDKNNKMLPREVGNGILNSVLKGDLSAVDGLNVCYFAWDYTWTRESRDPNWDEKYEDRWRVLCEIIKEHRVENIFTIETQTVYSLEQASIHFQSAMSRGLEGTVLKHPDAEWKDGTSKKIIKYKVEAEVDLKCTAILEGTGKNAGRMGSCTFESSDGLIKVNVGIGWKEKNGERDEIWNNQQEYIGRIGSIKANDVISKEGSDILSLFLPAIIEWRYDKTEADSKEKIIQIFDSVKNGGL